MRFLGLLQEAGKPKDKKAILQNEMITGEPFTFNSKKNKVHVGLYSNKRRLPVMQV